MSFFCYTKGSWREMFEFTQASALTILEAPIQAKIPFHFPCAVRFEERVSRRVVSPVMRSHEIS